MQAQFTNGQDAKLFTLAGKAKLTVASKSGERFTYKIRSKKLRQGGVGHFVSVLTGSNNTSDYTFIGTIFDGSRFVYSKKSRLSAGAKSVQGWEWVWKWIREGRLPNVAELWHSGKCGKCNRDLTVPSSIATGLGPICAAAIRPSQKMAA